MKRLILTICLSVLFVNGTASADWMPSDPYKMHFPQLPDPCGWDVAFDSMTLQRPLADDWQCTKTGPVSDIHLWLSWVGDKISQITALHVAIYSDKPYDEYTNPFSTPDTILWERLLSPDEMTYYGSGDQGFFNPHGGPPAAHDHDSFYQINITDIQNPFIQQEDTIYWLGINVFWIPGGETEIIQPGWKTSENHFNDGAVYLENGYWMQLVYPSNDPLYRTGNLDLAFVITPEPATVALLGLGALSLLRRRRGV